MKSILLVLFGLITLNTFGQTTVNRKIGQRWDKFTSNNWAGQDSLVYNYNAYGLESDRFAERGQSNNTWLFQYRTTSTYDAQQNVSSLTRENWTSNGWENITKYTYAYNLNNQKTEVLYQVWNTTSNTWKNTGRINNTYNSNQKQTKLESFSWDGSTWQPTTKQDFIYNANSDLSNHELFNFGNGIYNKVERRQYQYAFGFVSSFIRSTPDSLGTWIPLTRTLNAINGSATPPRIATSSIQSRDLINSIWADSLKTSYSYTNNLLTLAETEKFNPSLQSWNYQKLNSFVYNGNNLLVEEKNQNYVNGGYQNTLRKVLTYNGNMLNDSIIFYGDNGSNGWTETARDQITYNSKDSLIYRLNETYTNSAFVPNEQYFYHYANIPVGLAQYSNLFSQARLYPSPSSGFIAIQTEEKINGAHQSTIYSLDGKILWSQINTVAIENVKIDITKLVTGNYILQITELSSGKTQHFKFSKN